MLICAKNWGLNNTKLSKDERMRIAHAASKLVSYDNGYQKESSVRSVQRWDMDVVTNIKSETNSKNIGKGQFKLKEKQTDRIKLTCPGYLLYLFRYAIKVRGSKARFDELADCMNKKIRIPSESRPSVNL